MDHDNLDDLPGKQVRELLEGTLGENKKIERDLVDYAIERAGFAPDSVEGRALTKLYDGEPDVEAIREFAAQELGWEPPKSDEALGTEGEGEGNAFGWTPERRQAMDDGEVRRSAMANGTLPSRDPSDSDRMKEAAAKGDWETHDRLAAQAVSRQDPA